MRDTAFRIAMYHLYSHAVNKYRDVATHLTPTSLIIQILHQKEAIKFGKLRLTCKRMIK